MSGLTEHLLLLTATPHRGREDTFKCLLQLLDEDIFATTDLVTERVRELTETGVNKFFIRRLKEDMRDWDNLPLYKQRFTKTAAYNLTPDEKRLYDAVTAYLTRRRAEASQTKNIHVSLALQVMQRRLVSSIFAIKNTLYKRWQSLQGLADELTRNPNLWRQRPKLDEFEQTDIEDFDDLDDEERDALDTILSDPRKFRLFTTAKVPADIREEANEVKALYEMANRLYTSQQEEQKFKELKSLLTAEDVIGGEKLVIFTEHRDTLIYLQERLTGNGYNVATIHGGMSVDERREAQCLFAQPDTQILIATDAAGEGINLQFCRLLINWDIPWNPNRLEQRMGRIHRYGQRADVLVFNMVADNTREGQVLRKLLQKLDIIREQLGDDRVYDVIQDVLKGVPLGSIISSVFDGRENELDAFVDKSASELSDLFRRSISEQSSAMAHSTVDYCQARQLKEDSDERRLQPIYIRRFFEHAFTFLGGKYEQLADGIFQITAIPEVLAKRLRDDYHLHASNFSDLYFFFDKQRFLDYRQSNVRFGRAHYINPGNPLFDALLATVCDSFRDDAMCGAVLVSPDDAQPFFAFFVSNQIIDNRTTETGEPHVAGEQLVLVCQNASGRFWQTSPAKLLDHVPPLCLRPLPEVPQPATCSSYEVLAWTFDHITELLLQETAAHVEEDVTRRRDYLQSAFIKVIMDLQNEINDLQSKSFFSEPDEKTQQKLALKETRLMDLKRRKQERMAELEADLQLSPKAPSVMGCAYVVPLTQMEFQHTFGMSRDDEVEATAMQVAMDYERQQGRLPEDVSRDNLGYDLRSTDAEGCKRYIEVKGRAATDGVMLSENEMNRLAQLEARAWLYIVTNCKSTPQLHRINNPANRLIFEQKSKGIQYYLPLNEWQQKASSEQ